MIYKYFYTISFLFLTLFFITSCKQGNPTLKPLNSGVVITFDDDFTQEWSDAHDFLKDYLWKATFFVSDYEALSSSQIVHLQSLQAYGHEIGAHGLNHLNAPQTIKQIGKDKCLSTEIFPQLEMMKADQFKISTFAYPYGARNKLSDSLLLENFKLIRGTTYGDTVPSAQSCFYANKSLVNGLGIDNNYPHFSLEYITKLLDYAKENDKFLVLYAHRPVEEVEADYETAFQTLQTIAEFVDSNNMQFLTFPQIRISLP